MERDEIRCVTEREYWGRFEPSQLNDAMRYYVCEGHKRLEGKSLLEAELEFAKAAGNMTPRSCETLVLLVGLSLEPLLQSVCVYRPHRVVLMLNEKDYPCETPEPWQAFAGHVTEAIGYLVEKGLLSQLPQFPGKDGQQGHPTADKPEAVFKRLVEVLYDETDVVIEVTGGKKSMVSGAYMYAAYSGARISYVDFDEYDPKQRRPYGYSSKIGELANPYQEFALREWERIRALYGRYQFSDAQTELDSVLPTMKRVMPETEQAILNLAAFLEYYEHWDRGDYRGAKQVASNLGSFEQPSAVTVLGNQWFEVSGQDFVDKPKHFYGNLPALQAYVCDEMARIRRLVDCNEDYRSAFLRAGGVNEIVMLARVVSLVSHDAERMSLLEPLNDRTPDVRKVFSVLLDAGRTHIDVPKDIPFRNAPKLSIPLPGQMRSWWKTTNLFNADNGWEIFLTRRNELIHKFFSVPREWAEDALRFTQANFEDFLGHPMADLNLRTTTMSWPELCHLCGISNFLSPNLRKEAKT